MRKQYSVGIDKNDLDRECVETPQDFDSWSRSEIKEQKKKDNLKKKFESVKAEVELELRGMDVKKINAKYKLKLEKKTEAAIQALILLTDEYEEALDNLNSALYEYRMAGVARKSFEMKKSSLDNLVKLHGQGYFAKVEGRDYKKRKVREQKKRLR